MRQFLYSWQRKAGVVTLVMALVLTGEWIRSRVVQDQIILGVNKRCHVVVSSRGYLRWFAIDDGSPPFLSWRSGVFTDISNEKFLLATGRGTAVVTVYAGRDWIVPYAFGAVPLTLLSAYLLLSQPRKRLPIASEPHA
jgi:hypothetical protein